MIGMDVDFFKPQSPNDFTVGRLLPITQYSRNVKNIMSGLGYQEMIFNYLGSKATYIDKMNIDGKDVIEIANPMSENYQFIRPSIIASLFEAEAQSGNAVYPHKIYEVGKIAYIDPSENTGTKTVQSLGFLSASNNANFNDAAAEVSTLLYYLDHKYEVKETNDPRFIPGRQAGIIVDGKQCGIFGEIHPQVLENWQVGAAVHEYNFPSAATICADIKNISGDDIRERAGIGKRDVDIVFGGAPCQGFSMIGKRALDDPRNQLIGHFLRIVKDIRPKYCVLENSERQMIVL